MCVCVCASLSASVSCSLKCRVHRTYKSVSDSMELELQVIVSYLIYQGLNLVLLQGQWACSTTERFLQSPSCFLIWRRTVFLISRCCDESNEIQWMWKTRNYYTFWHFSSFHILSYDLCYWNIYCFSENNCIILSLEFGFDYETTCAFLPPSEQWKFRIKKRGCAMIQMTEEDQNSFKMIFV